MNSVNEIDTINRTYSFFDDMINVRNLDLHSSKKICGYSICDLHQE